MSGPDDPDARRFVARRLAALGATPAFCADEATNRAILARWEAMRALGVAADGAHDGSWQLVSTRDPHAWFGGPTTLVFADRAAGDAAALSGLVAALAANGAHRSDDAWLEIDPRDDALLAALLADGWHVDSVIHAGSLATARDRMDAVLGDGLGRAPRWRPLEMRHVEGAVALHAATFSAAPEWCWFGAYPRHLERMRDGMVGWCAAPDDAIIHWVVEGPTGVIGHVSLDITDEAFWGRCAGLGVVLGPEARGQGLLREAYRRAIVVARAEGATVWKGGTSQPAVLALGARLGRTWHQVGLRRVGRDLGVDHFTRFKTLSDVGPAAFAAR